MESEMERTFRKIAVDKIKKTEKNKEDRGFSPDEFYTSIIDDTKIRKGQLAREDELKMARLWDKYKNSNK